MASRSHNVVDRSRSRRLEARITVEQKALIERAAEIEGRSITDFVVASAQAAAKRTVADHETLSLGHVDSRAFVEAMLNSPPVNDRLRDTLRRYRDISGV